MLNNYSLLTTHYLLLTIHYSLLTIHYFMQNKPNFQIDKMNVTLVITKDYENKIACELRQNKPNQTQFQTRPCSLFSRLWCNPLLYFLGKCRIERPV